METLLLVGIAALFALALAGSGPQAAQSPKVIYVVAEPQAREGGGGGCLLLLAVGVIVLLALSIPG